MSHTGPAAPCQLTMTWPPGRRTLTLSSSSPSSWPDTTAAQAPVPQAVVSALSDAVKISDALSLGAKAYIRKPLEFNSDEFIQILKEDILDSLEP